MRGGWSSVVAYCTALLATTPAVAQRVPLPRLVREALAPPRAARWTLPTRWPRAPLGDPTPSLGEPVSSALLNVPMLPADAGRGATVCVIDTGLDLTHPALRTPAGGTRVRALLDLDAPPRSATDATLDPAVRALEDEFGAAVWDRATIDAALLAGDDGTLPNDAYGHGTAATALAAGAGLGLAPGADVVVVRAWRRGVPGFRDEDLVAGGAFCARAAVDATRTVVLLALGGHDGAHDGSEPVERALAAHPGLVVAAAGNDGDAPVHARLTLAGAEARIPVRVPDPSGDAEAFVALAVTLADAPGDFPLALALEAPDGTLTEWSDATTSTAVDASGARLSLSADERPRADGTRVVYAVVAGGGDVPAALEGGEYAVRLRGRGRAEVWIAGASLPGALFRPRLAGPHVDATGTVTIPGTSADLLTVGAIAARTSLGALVRDGDTTGAPASFTSAGPTRDGAPKPDVSAPGTFVVSALSRDVRAGEPNLLGGSAAALDARTVATGRIALDGSSWSAALVAGAVAVALAESPSRGAADRALLAATATPWDDAAWNPRGGTGRMDVARFLDARRVILSGTHAPAPVDVRTSRAAFTRASSPANASDLHIIARVLDGRGAPLPAGALRVSESGRTVLTLSIRDGLASGPFPPEALEAMPAWPAGAERSYEVYADDIRLPPLRLRLDEPASVSPPEPGGCAAIGLRRPRRDELLAIPFFAAILAGLRRRRRASSPVPEVPRAVTSGRLIDKIRHFACHPPCRGTRQRDSTGPDGHGSRAKPADLPRTPASCRKVDTPATGLAQLVLLLRGVAGRNRRHTVLSGQGEPSHDDQADPEEEGGLHAHRAHDRRRHHRHPRRDRDPGLHRLRPPLQDERGDGQRQLDLQVRGHLLQSGAHGPRYGSDDECELHRRCHDGEPAGVAGRKQEGPVDPEC
jgi:hypothetical protein